MADDLDLLRPYRGFRTGTFDPRFPISPQPVVFNDGEIVPAPKNASDFFPYPYLVPVPVQPNSGGSNPVVTATNGGALGSTAQTAAATASSVLGQAGSALAWAETWIMAHLNTTGFIQLGLLWFAWHIGKKKPLWGFAAVAAAIVIEQQRSS